MLKWYVEHPAYGRLSTCEGSHGTPNNAAQCVPINLFTIQATVIQGCTLEIEHNYRSDNCQLSISVDFND